MDDGTDFAVELGRLGCRPRVELRKRTLRGGFLDGRLDEGVRRSRLQRGGGGLSYHDDEEWGISRKFAFDVALGGVSEGDYACYGCSVPGLRDVDTMPWLP